MISITSLSKSYGDHQILNDIHLVFAKGEIHGIIGENGSGKTTLFKCLCGLEDFKGSVEFDGGVLKNQTGFLPTFPYYLSHMTGLEYLRLLCNARGIVNRNIEKYNLFELPLNQYAEIYSTGMQKKLAITGLLLQKNEVFILDEPFNGVDMSSNMIIHDILLKLKQLNKTIILSSHIFSTLQDTCDFLHYLKDGKIKYSLPKGSFETIENEIKNGSLNENLIESIYADNPRPNQF
jgi:ABC-2 type transport system ATP-binding protein